MRHRLISTAIRSRLPLTASYPRAKRYSRLCVLAGAMAWLAANASAQELVVVESSQQDRASVDKLAELLREPFERVSADSAPAGSVAAAEPDATQRVAPSASDAPEMTEPSHLRREPPASACRTHARLELVLDSAQHVVKLTRCNDGTVLSRAIDPNAARETPYLGAFVAAELLAIQRELETTALDKASRAQGTRPESVNESPSAPALAAPSTASGPASTVVPELVHEAQRPDRLQLQLRLGAELSLWGAPFDRVLRPSVSLGFTIARAETSAWLIAVALSPFGVGRATLTRPGEQLQLRRRDGQLRIGIQQRLHPLRLAAFALGRASITTAEYANDTPASTTKLRVGVGAGVDAEVVLSQSFALYAQVVLDLATSRSDYQVAGVSWVRDPSSLLWIGLGLSLQLGL